MAISDSLYNLIDQGRLGKNKGLSTGIPKLDEYMGGTMRSTYYLYFGLSGSGKSSIVLYSHIFRPLMDSPDINFTIIYYSLEMSTEVLLAKLLCLYVYEKYGVKITYIDLLSRQSILDDDRYTIINNCKSWIDDVVSKHLIIYDKALSSASFYASMMDLYKKWGKLSQVGTRTVYNPSDPNHTVVCIADHLGLITPAKGRDKKQEIDLWSAYAVQFREKYGATIIALMQENRNSSSMDRRKSDMSECSSEDIKDTGNVYNDCEICVGIYFPLKHKLTTYRDYRILGPDPDQCLRDRFRSAILIKNRFGQSDKVIPMNFFGEIGLFKELPPGKSISNYKPYTTLEDKTEDQPVKTGNLTTFSF